MHTCMPWRCRSQRTAWWSQIFHSTFEWVPGTELRSSCSHNKCFYLLCFFRRCWSNNLPLGDLAGMRPHSKNQGTWLPRTGLWLKIRLAIKHIKLDLQRGNRYLQFCISLLAKELLKVWNQIKPFLEFMKMHIIRAEKCLSEQRLCHIHSRLWVQIPTTHLKSDAVAHTCDHTAPT